RSGYEDVLWRRQAQDRRRNENLVSSHRLSTSKIWEAIGTSDRPTRRGKTMFDHTNHVVVEPELRPQENVPQEANPQEVAPGDVTETVTPHEPNGEASNQHAEAGRKGAQRLHQLIQLGRLYEQEHGLKRGRQRLRQLIQEGKLYE